MSIIKKIVKTLSECYLEYVSFTLDESSGIGTIKVKAKNHFCNAGSFSDGSEIDNSIQYSIDGGINWNDCTIENIIDLTDIKLNGIAKEIEIEWDVKTDLGILTNYDNIEIRIRINDDIELTGTYSSYVTSGILNIDLRPSSDISPIRPYSSEDDFYVSFKTPVSLENCRLHFVIYVDTVNTFNSDDLKTYDSKDSQIGWTYDGGSFPSNGALCGSTIHDIGYSNSELTNLAEGTYFVKIEISEYNSP